MKKITFFDFEVDSSGAIRDIGAICSDERRFHGKSVPAFKEFMKPSDLIAGHNIVKHDLVYLHKYLGDKSFGVNNSIDTLLLAPLLFPSRPYHNLVKDEKLQTDELNNPLSDSIKAQQLFYDEVAAFSRLSEEMKNILYNLLSGEKGFACFFEFVDFSQPLSKSELASLIKSTLSDSICSDVDVGSIIERSPVPMAYAIALINANEQYSITPPWVLHSHKNVEQILRTLRGRPCLQGCEYCIKALNPYTALNEYFGFDGFRTYDGKPMQEDAVNAAIHGESLLAVFPTGGGKSITFQLPALMDGKNTKSLTVIISPLQSLMKDQVDNLERKGITNAATINGMLDPIERSKSIERVQEGSVHLLYLSPESLRSVTIEKLLLGRKISRFVIDEAHCFSSWGQDFRVDYLYIGDFIRNLQIKKGLDEKIPVSCFTATAKLQVIEDIKNYFKDKLSLDLKLLSSDASRTNLHYKVYQEDGDDQKYAEIRRLLDQKQCPTIIYVSRTKTATKLAAKLVEDGFLARAFHGKMDKEEKATNQNDFISGSVDVMVATSAFGMGVDKSDVGMVIHYNISDSLENYVQEAGRAGRDESITADCYVLFNEEDLNKHFLLLNQTKLDIKEINQVWKAIKDLTKNRDKVSNSALEIARKAGWDDSMYEVETKVTTAIAALEDANYLKRGQNAPRIFATSILCKTAQEAIDKIQDSPIIPEDKKVNAKRIIRKMIASKNRSKNSDEQAESRIDYIAEHLGIPKYEVIEIVQLLRDDKILADSKDLTAFIKRSESKRIPLNIFEKFKKLEDYFISVFDEEAKHYNLKELNDQARQVTGKEISPQDIKTLLNFWAIKGWIKRSSNQYSKNHINTLLTSNREEFKRKTEIRHQVVQIIIEYLFTKAGQSQSREEDVLIDFSIGELKDRVLKNPGLFKIKASSDDIEDSLFFLSRIGAIKIEGGFLVTYNKLTIQRTELNNLIKYKQEDYRKLEEFYNNKKQQIHIVGEYAKRMTENYKDALQFVDDYFRLNYTSFLNKYFPGSRREEIKRPMTPKKFQELFGALSPAQLKIITDREKYILVAAGPGSGKTRVLVHKLASLLWAEDIKHEQLLMLTFSRAAATEFKKRLLDLIGPAAHFVEIKTFHSYCFDLLGQMGNLGDAGSIVQKAVEKIKNREIELSQATKAVLVIDEAQDMNAEDYALVSALMDLNEDMRVVMVGDDDQNIFEFRHADSRYMQDMVKSRQAKLHELIVNYRSRSNLVSLTNQWVSRLTGRLKKLPIVAEDSTIGSITITEHTTDKLVVPAVQSIMEAELAGTTCVLTHTNEEAALVAGLLINHGLPAKLIQSKDGFNLYDLKELRWFCDNVLQGEDSPLIGEEDWIEAKKRFASEFRNSNKLDACILMIDRFESVNPTRKYKSDWKSFVQESKFEDFIRISNEVIYVSTLHKAKGKEFDNVFLLLTNTNPSKQAVKREVYVAMTRAKQRLVIHYNGSYLSNLKCDNLIYKRDMNKHPEPEHISLVLTHNDVYLDYFAFVQHRLADISCGSSLLFTNEGLSDPAGNRVLKFSRPFSDNLKKRYSSYTPNSASTNFIVYWKNKDTQKEIKILLPELTLSRLEQ